ncbi:MAG: hypothetical protein V8R97_12530 [Fusicatenibacter saccharivorans]
MIGSADLIICGRQTTDGDTAQVGPSIAEHLTIPHAAWVAEVTDVTDHSITVRQDLVSVSQVSGTPLFVPDYHRVSRARADRHFVSGYF